MADELENPGSPSSSKRLKQDWDLIFEDPLLERSAQSILENGTDGTGYISGTIFMRWPARNKKIGMIMESGNYRFETWFTDRCADFSEHLGFLVHDQVRLALKDAVVEDPVSVSRTCNSKRRLRYSKGVIVQFIKRPRGLKAQTVNTWDLEDTAGIDDWFCTPKFSPHPHPSLPPPLPPQSLEAIAGANSRSTDNTRHIPILPTGQEPSRRDRRVSGEQRRAMQQCESSSVSVKVKPDPPLSKKQLKRLKKLKRKALEEGQTRTPSQAHGEERIRAEQRNHPEPRAVLEEKARGKPDPEEQQIHNNRPAGSQGHQHLDPEKLDEQQPHVPRHDHSDTIQPLGADNPTSSAHRLARGLRAEMFLYKPIASVTLRQFVNLIGVVTRATVPSKAVTGQWSCTVKIVDPSNVTVDDYGTPESFQVTCFSYKHEEWLPQPRADDVVILQSVMIVDYHGTKRGTGYPDKLRWAVYAPDSKQIRNLIREGVPRSEKLADGHGYEFSPFLTPSPLELGHCQQLSKWWQEVKQMKEESFGEIHQISGPSFSQGFYGRRHRLISEAGPDVEPQGYFDCTVEILHGEANDYYYTLRVTDYTLNPATGFAQAEWCPAGLEDYVLRLEVWDNAKSTAITMKPGDYYTIRNARMKVGPNGYIQAKVVEDKMTKLTEADANYDPRLKELLERKKAWQKANDTSQHFEHRLIKDSIENEHFNSVVEILHIKTARDGLCYLYATDYTSRKDLSPVPVEDWSKSLEGLIVTIALWDGQARHAESIECGSYCLINKMRLKKHSTKGTLQGNLGGVECLIHMLNPRNRANEHLVALIERRTRFREKCQASSSNGPGQAELENTNHAPFANRASVTRYHCTPIKLMKSSVKCPNKFRIRARIIDFYPLQLCDAVIVYCRNCGNDVPANQRACFGCSDIDHEYVQYKYQLWFLLQDEAGDQLHVSVNDDSLLFQGLKRADIRSDVSAYATLRKRIEPVVGDLLQVHDDIEKGINLTPETPELTWIIGSWEVEGERGYCLLNQQLEENGAKS